MVDEPPRADCRPIMAGPPADDGPRSGSALASRVWHDGGDLRESRIEVRPPRTSGYCCRVA
jgi:hypothetical protein